MQNNQKIPEGWSVKKISDLGSVVSGGTPDTNNPEYWDGDVLWVTPSEVSNLSNRFLYSTERKITEKGLKESSAKLLPINSLIICTRATIGDCCINKVPMCTNQGFKNIIVKNNNVDFLYYLITKNKNELIRKACGSTFLEISKKDIDNLKFAIPPLPEQEKIAGILGTWDEAIEKLSSLIEQKKLLKKGLMQRLLTGKTRLPTFTQPWKEVKLGKVCKLETTTSKSAFIDENGKYYIIDMGAVSTEGTLISSKRTNACEDLLKINDIVMPKDDIGGGNIIGKTAIIKQENTYVLSDHVFKLKIHDSDAMFISYLINSFKYNKYMRRMSSGSAILGLAKKDIEKCMLYIPSDTNEQQAIADVLSTADDEINLLNQKLEALKEQKKGLMQQLLTGQIRVKVN
ncbi:MAG: hypothetical protein E7013_06620 [Alphaproteobacteria bacterium]|nr:hypothetical protein [Alphaproteobacteria bacterium]